MEEFRGLVERLAAMLNEISLGPEQGVTPERLREIMTDLLVTDNINFYPGIPSHQCCDLALFISLRSRTYARGGHLGCADAMSRLVQHMQGACSGKTTTAVFVTDNWDSAAFDAWSGNLARINESSRLEIYLLCGRAVSPVMI